MTYFLKSPYPCLVKAGKCEFEIEESDTLEISDEDFLFIYPQNGNIPFYINLKEPKENNFFSITSYDHKKYIILEKEDSLSFSTKKTLFFSGKRCEVCASDKNITFESDATKIEIKHLAIGKIEEIFKVNDYACVQFENDFYAFSTKTNQIFHLQGKISREGDSLKVAHSFSDSIARQRQAEFKLSEKLELKHETFLRNEGSKNVELLPYQLLESVKAKDFSFALSTFSENLKNKLDNSKILQFFGNFSDFLPITTTQFITIAPENKNFVTFELKNGKICDIEIEKI